MAGEFAIRGYEIGSKIKGGGMGDVYHAHDIGLDRPVAIKILRDALAEDPDFVQRFLREARMCARLNHLNIVLLWILWCHMVMQQRAGSVDDGEQIVEVVRNSTR